MAVHEPDYQQFLQRLRQARLEAELTQVQVAERLQKPQSFVAKCESGDRRVDVVELARLARIYGKPMGWFVEGDRPDIAVC